MKALELPDVRKTLTQSLGMDIVASSPEATAHASSARRWRAGATWCARTGSRRTDGRLNVEADQRLRRRRLAAGRAAGSSVRSLSARLTPTHLNALLTMNARTDQLLGELLSLPLDERTEVAVALLDSLESEDAGIVSEVWRDEIRQRKEDIRAGKAKLISWDEARARILAL